MKRTILLLIILSLWAFTLNAQNNKETLQHFKSTREKEFKEFSKNKEAEYIKLVEMYEKEFIKFKRLYSQCLENEANTINIMKSDDNVEITKKAPTPQIIASDSESEIKLILDEKHKISKLTPIDFVIISSNNSSNLDSTKNLKNQKPTDKTIKETEEALKKISEINTSLSNESDNPSASKQVEKAENTYTSTKNINIEDKTENRSLNIPSGKPTKYSHISSKFGTRIHPITQRRHTHKGVDLAAGKMTPICATADGLVTYSGRNGGYGNFVKLNHQNGYKTAYAHMAKIVVNKNTRIRKGDIIGYVGSTGRSTGNHLHYEVYYDNKLLDPEKTL